MYLPAASRLDSSANPRFSCRPWSPLKPPCCQRRLPVTHGLCSRSAIAGSKSSFR